MSLVRARALRPGDGLAVLAPASPFDRGEFEAGIAELRALGFVPVFDDSVFAVDRYLAGEAATRAAALRGALADPRVTGIIAVRGGYGSVHTLPLLDPAQFRAARKPLVGYSDVTSLLSFLTCHCGMVGFHGPMLAGRLARGVEGYDRDSFLRAVGEASPLGELRPEGLEVMIPGEAAGPLYGGTMTLLAASLGTPFAFDPPPGHVLLVEDVGEPPYRLDRLFTQLRLAGIFEKASALVFGEMLGCDDPGGGPTARDTLAQLTHGFPGPVLFNFPTGHTSRAEITVPLGVSARVVASGAPALVIDEPAVGE